MKNIDDIIKNIELSGDEVESFKKSSQEDIESFTQQTGFSLPSSYQSFCLEYGNFEYLGNYLNGVKYLINETEKLKKKSDLPHGFYVLSSHEDGAFCLDFNRQNEVGECPVVNYEFSSNQHETPVAKTFEEYLTEFYLYFE